MAAKRGADGEGGAPKRARHPEESVSAAKVEEEPLDIGALGLDQLRGVMAVLPKALNSLISRAAEPMELAARSAKAMGDTLETVMQMGMQIDTAVSMGARGPRLRLTFHSSTFLPYREIRVRMQAQLPSKDAGAEVPADWCRIQSAADSGDAAEHGGAELEMGLPDIFEGESCSKEFDISMDKPRQCNIVVEASWPCPSKTLSAATSCGIYLLHHCSLEHSTQEQLDALPSSDEDAQSVEVDVMKLRDLFNIDPVAGVAGFAGVLRLRGSDAAGGDIAIRAESEAASERGRLRLRVQKLQLGNLGCALITDELTSLLS